jgi:hypothetical protein
LRASAISAWVQKLHPHVGDNPRRGLRRRPFVPWLEDPEFDGGIRLSRIGQEVKAADRADDIDARRTFEHVPHLFGHRIGALQGRAIRKLDHNEEIALILNWQEAGRDAPREEKSCAQNDSKQ